MNFTRPWDDTQPPDTQPANQLGLAIRQMKQDVGERFKALSGTFAERPNVMDPEFGAALNGVLYFAVDTSQIFRWDGAAWQDITNKITTGLLDYQDQVVVNNTGVANYQRLYRTIVPRGRIPAGRGVRITIWYAHNSANPQVNLYHRFLINGVALVTIPAQFATGQVPYETVIRLMNRPGLTNGQRLLYRDNYTTFVSTQPAIDSVANDLTLDFEVASDNATSITGYSWIVEYI